MNGLLFCCCKCHSNPPAQDEFINVTRVMDYAGGSDGIAPYARPWYYISAGSCISEEGVSCGNPGDPVCYNKSFDGSTNPYVNGIPAGIMNCTPTIPGRAVTVHDGNCYMATGNQISYSDDCRKYGWKGVLAEAVWPGMFGFVNSGASCCPDGGQEQSKYTTVKETRHGKYHEKMQYSNGCPGYPGKPTVEKFYEFTAIQVATVDGDGNVSRSGSVTLTSWVRQNGVDDPGAVYNECRFSEIGGYLTIVPGNGATLSGVCGSMSFKPFSTTYTGTKEELEAYEIGKPSADTDFVTCPDDGSPSGIQTRTTGTTNGFEFEFSDGKIEANLNYTTEYTGKRCCSVGSLDFNYDLTGFIKVIYNHKVELSGSIAFSDVLKKAQDHLDNWPLNDDAVYPWRRDASTWLIPFVRRDAGPSQPTIDWAQDDFCSFINSTPYSGDLIGVPLPAGYGPHFNYSHINWIAGSGAGICGACQESLGAMGASPVPYAATSWTDKSQGAFSYGPGAHIVCGHPSQFGPTAGDLVNKDYVYAQKWAETLEAWPSLNFSRPCGPDRYLRDETAVACILSFDGVNLEIDTAPAVEFEVGDTVGLDDGGVYQIATKTDAQHYTVGGKLYDAPGGYDGAAKLRFTSARAIASSLNATAVQSSPGVITITTNKKHWLKGGGSQNDTVDFTGIGGLGSGVTATYVSDTTFTVPGTLTTPTSGTISSTGVTAEQIAFDTTCTTHRFLARTWQSDYRDGGGAIFNEVERTLNPVTTSPTVLWCSPNSRDTFANGYQLTWGSIEADQCEGSEWHGDFIQAVVDPYWQTPQEPCGHSGEWAQAAGPCVAEDDNHYKFPPLVEPRIMLPPGAPELPAGVTLHEEGAMPNQVGHPNCSIDPYDEGPVHIYREAFLTCTEWDEATSKKC